MYNIAQYSAVDHEVGVPTTTQMIQNTIHCMMKSFYSVVEGGQRGAREPRITEDTGIG